MWQPIISSQTDFETWLGTIVTRAAKHTEWRVGTTFYSTATALEQAILKEAETVLAQYYLLLAAAGIADSSDSSDQNPAINSGDKLREDAKAYLDRYDQLLRHLGHHPDASRTAIARATHKATTEEIVPD